VDSAGTVFSAVRWAAEMPTKSYSLVDGELRTALFTSTESTPSWESLGSEAKRHELLLGYFSTEVDDSILHSAACVAQRPPRLWNPAWAQETAALTRATGADPDSFPELRSHQEEAYGDYDRATLQVEHYDLRDFGDRAVQEGWANNYYDMSRGLLAEYLRTGHPAAFDRAAEFVNHQIDMDVFHRWDDDKRGGSAGYGGDHLGTGYVWNALTRIGAGWAYYGRLTGDPDVRQAARELADYYLRTGSYDNMYSSRDHGGALTALTWAYEDSRDDRYRVAGEALVKDVRKRMAERRGAYLEVHGNHSYWVMVPWMDCEVIDALRRFWEAAGSEQALETAVLLTEAMLAEAGTWDYPGELSGYTCLPTRRVTSNYHVLVAPTFMHGYELTGDPTFLLWGRACWDRTVADRSINHILNCYWMVPEALHYLERYREIPTPPVTAPEVLVRAAQPPLPDNSTQ
jgi:hypothetical protein